MKTFTYVIEISDDGQTWMPENDEAAARVDAGTAAEAAREVLDRRLDELPSDSGHGWYRVAVWGSGGPGYVGGADEVLTVEPRGAVVWSVVRRESPGSRAVDPRPLDVELPDEILEWAAGHGLHVDDPDVYMLVTPADEAGEVLGEVAYRYGRLPVAEVEKIRAAVGG